MNFDFPKVKQYMTAVQKEITNYKNKLAKLKADIEEFEKATSTVDGQKVPVWSGKRARLCFLHLRQHYNRHANAANAMISFHNEVVSQYNKVVKANSNVTKQYSTAVKK